jgi:hypothetical protein
MRKQALVSCAVVCALALLGGTSAFAGDAWIGTWKLKEAKSKPVAGTLQAQTLTFEAVGDGIKLTTAGTDAAGQPIKAGYTAKFDGTDAPWAGNPTADTAAPVRVDDHTYTNAWKKGGKVVVNAKVEVSKDGKTMTITQTPVGGGEASVGVYEKQ